MTSDEYALDTPTLRSFVADVAAASCIWRHAFDPGSGEERPFRSGYVNVACEEDT